MQCNIYNIITCDKARGHRLHNTPHTTGQHISHCVIVATPPVEHLMLIDCHHGNHSSLLQVKLLTI